MVSDRQKMKIVAYGGINYPASDIADETGLSETTIYKYQNEWKKAAKEADNPIREVYGPIVMDGVFSEQFAVDLSTLFFGGLD